MTVNQIDWSTSEDLNGNLMYTNPETAAMLANGTLPVGQGPLDLSGVGGLAYGQSAPPWKALLEIFGPMVAASAIAGIAAPGITSAGTAVGSGTAAATGTTAGTGTGFGIGTQLATTPDEAIAASLPSFGVTAPVAGSAELGAVASDMATTAGLGTLPADAGLGTVGLPVSGLGASAGAAGASALSGLPSWLQSLSSLGPLLTAASRVSSGVNNAQATSGLVDAITKAATELSTAGTNASNSTQASTQQILDFLQKQYGIDTAQLAPYTAAGGQAISQLSDLMKPGGFLDPTATFSPTDMETVDPGYAFRLQQGDQAINRYASASGGVSGGATLKALSRYNQDYASNEYQNAFNRFNTQRQTGFNNLSTVAGLGENAATTTANLGQNLATTSANTISTGTQQANNYNIEAANARASGYVGGANVRAANPNGIGTNIVGDLGQLLNPNNLSNLYKGFSSLFG